MFNPLAGLGDPLRRSGVIRPLGIGAAGAIGVAAVRHNGAHAPIAVFAAAIAVVVATTLRERGFAVAALGVAAAAAFASPAGLGPFMVLTGAVIGAVPASVDRRLAQWPEVVDAVIAIPAVAGLANAAAASPSQRGVAVAVTAIALVVATWWRGPRHGHVAAARPSIGAYLGMITASVVVLAPSALGRLGDLSDATVQAGHGVATAFAVFLVACLIQTIRAGRRAIRGPIS